MRYSIIIYKLLSYRRETALQGGVSYGQKWKTNITGLSSTTVTYLAVIGEETQNKSYYPVQGHPRYNRGRYQSKARMRLPISD